MEKFFSMLCLLAGLGFSGYGVYRVLYPNPAVLSLGWTRAWAPGAIILIIGVMGLVGGITGWMLSRETARLTRHR